MEEERRLWRDTLLKQIVFNDVWYPHPTLNYEGNTQGELRNITSKKLIRGCISDGYRRVGGDRNGVHWTMVYHRVLMECFYNVTIPPQYDIDHKNAKPLDNTFDNLQILTRKEHAQKTSNQNPGMQKKSGKNRSYRIVRFRIGENGERIEEMFFDSMSEAQRSTSTWRASQLRSIEKDVPDQKGYHWARANECNNDDLPGEEWRQVPGLREGMFVSNKGRVWFKYRPNPYKTYGNETPEGYFTVSCGEQEIKVHRVVILAFTGPPPTDDHTVDHIDRDRGNNCIENLRWATASEQAKNREGMRPIEIYNPANPGAAGKIFDTMSEAAKEYGVTRFAVQHAVHSHRAGQDPFSTYHINLEKTLSARYADLTNEEKLNRELSFFDHQVEKAKQSPHSSRKSNTENLPIGISRRKNGLLVAQMKFLGNRFYMSGDDPAALAREREEWFNKVVEDHKAFIRQSFDNNTPQSATLPTTP
jgi:hypothetical protein